MLSFFINIFTKNKGCFLEANISSITESLFLPYNYLKNLKIYDQNGCNCESNDFKKSVLPGVS